MKIILQYKTVVGVCVALAAVFLVSIFLLTAQNSSAQIDIDTCQKEYQTRQFKCIDNLKACSDACDKSSAGNFEAFTSCQEPCNSRRNDCDAAANALYAECLGVGSPGLGLPMVDVTPAPIESPAGQQQPVTQPPAVTAPKTVVPAPVPTPAPAKTPERSDGDRQEIIVGGITYVPALVETEPTKNMFKDFVVVKNPDALLCAGANCTVQVRFFPQINMKNPDPVLCAGASCTVQIRFFPQINAHNLAGTELPIIATNDSPVISLPSGSVKDSPSFIIDVGKLTTDAQAKSEKPELSDEEMSQILQKNIAEILDRNKDVAVETIEISVPEAKSDKQPAFQSVEPQASYITMTYFDSSADAKGNPIVSPSILAVYSGTHLGIKQISDEGARGSGPAIEVSSGKAIFVVGWDAAEEYVAPINFSTKLDNIEVKHKKTAYGVSFDPQTGQKIVELYDGEIEISDKNTGKTLTVLSTTFDSPIKRIEIDASGNIEEQIAIPQSEWPAFVAKHQKSRSGVWLYVFGVAVLGAVTYFVYRKKDILIKMIKREPMQ